MSEQEPKEITSLHFDFKSRRLLGVFSDETVLQFTLTQDLKLLYHGHFKAAQPQDAGVREAIVHQGEAPTKASQQRITPEAGTRTPERQPVETLTGRLIDDVKRGKPDSRVNPTSFTLALLHVDGQETAQKVLITFHKNTMQLALDQLHEGDQITVQGYLRPAPPPKPGEKPRLDNFSAFQLINYPGKLPKAES